MTDNYFIDASIMEHSDVVIILDEVDDQFTLHVAKGAEEETAKQKTKDDLSTNKI